MKKNLDNITFAERLFKAKVNGDNKRLKHSSNDSHYYDRKELEATGYPVEYLNEFLKGYGFNTSQVTDMWNTTATGKQFFSDKYCVTVDRGKFLINNMEDVAATEFLIKKQDKIVKHPFFTLKIK